MKHKRCSPFNMALNYTMGCSPPCQPAFEGIFFSCSCSMLLFSFQLVLLKETHSQTPTMPWGIRVMVEGGQGLDGGLPRDIGEGWVVVRRKGEGVEPNINTDYVYMHTTKQVTGAIQVTAGNYRSCLHALQTRTWYSMNPQGFLNDSKDYTPYSNQMKFLQMESSCVVIGVPNVWEMSSQSRL